MATNRSAAQLFTLVEEALGAVPASGSEHALELADVEWLPGGLLRVTIDHVDGVSIDHCESVSRQLSRLFEVEGVNYQRLEVGSPGVDRPLRRAAEFRRFVGERIEIKLREAFQNQKVFVGQLVEVEPPVDAIDPTVWFGIELDGQARPGQPQLMAFSLDELERARLAPILNFKGRNK